MLMSGLRLLNLHKETTYLLTYFVVIIVIINVIVTCIIILYDASDRYKNQRS